MAIEDADARPASEVGGHEHDSSDALRIIRAAMDESFAGVLLTDTTGLIEYVNSSFEELTGRRACDVVGRSASILSTDEDLGQEIGAALRADGQWRGEIKSKRPDGEEYWMLASIQPLRSDDGEIRHYIGVNIDITERVRVEEELAESEAYWRALVENAPDLIVVVDEDGVVSRLNRAPPGSTMEDAVGRLVYDFVLPESREAWRKGLAEVFATGRYVEFEVTASDVRGRARWYAVMLGAVRDGDSVVAAVASMRDVTRRKQAEDDLKDREAHWRALVENASDLIAEVDGDGVIGRLNRDPVGSTIEAVVGKTVYDFALPESQAVWREALAKAFTEGERVDFEALAADGHGQIGWYATSIAPVCGDGGVVAAIVSERDITVLKEAEERMRAIATAVSDVIIVVDGDGVFLEVLAPTMKEGLLVLPPDDLRGRRIQEFLRPDQAELSLAFVRETVSSGKAREAEALIELPQGPMWLSARSAPLSLGDGSVVAVIHVADVTERKRAELEKQEAETRMRVQFNGIPVPVYVWRKCGDGDFELVDFNDAAARVTRGEVLKMSGVKASQLYADEPEIIDELSRCVSEQTPINRKMWYQLRATGESRYLDVTYAYAEPDLVLVHAADITERKEAEERLRAIATAVPDVITVLDEDGRVLEVLRSAEKAPLFVAEGVDARGTLVADYLPEADAKRALAFIKRTIETGEVQESLEDLKLPGREVWVAARAAPLTPADGTQAVVMHLLDVTERRRMEAELQRLREETEARAEEGVKRAAEYGLTFREISVLSLISRGKSDKEIAVLLGLSPFTVNKHSSNLVHKMGARSRSQAAARAVREGII